MSVSIWEETMLYDELVPKGEYLAHYGVPKDQWSPEAKARHNRRHPNKTIDPITIARGFLNVRDAYQENNNRGGNRSTFGSKVDEQRFQLAEARHRNRSQHNSGDEGNKPYSGQRVPNYRKPRGGQEPRQPNKPARDPRAKKDDSYTPYTISSRELVNSPYGNVRVELRDRGRKPREWNPDATVNPYHGKRAGKNSKMTSNPKSTSVKGTGSWDRVVKDKLKEQDKPNTTPAVSKTKKKFATSQELRPWPEQSTTSGKKPAQSTDNGWTKPKPTNKPKSKDINKKKKKQTNTK